MLIKRIYFATFNLWMLRRTSCLCRRFSKEPDTKEKLKSELLNNPMFDKVFPHLSKFKEPTQNPIEKEELGFIKSLFYKWRSHGQNDYDGIINLNNKNFTEGYFFPKGPLKYMSTEDKEKVHLIAEMRMNELEQLNFSREEILDPVSGRIGLKLLDDPFFQYIKSNRMIREIMIKPGEEFTPEKIVNLALRQDIGIDNASSINPKYIRDKKNLSYERKFRLDSDHPTREDYLRPQDYFSQEKGLNPMDFRKTRGLIEIGKPLRRGIIRKKSRRAINSLDIHWRNTALLSKFLTASSTIKTRIATCLPKFQQKRIARTIKHARNMNLLPFTGFLKSYHKKSLKTIHDDLQHTHQQLIDIETGAIKLTQPTTKWNHSKMISATEMGRFLRYNEKIDLALYNVTNQDFLTEDQDLLFKAARYANHLKVAETKARGVDVEGLQKQLKTHFAEIHNTNMQVISTEETLEEDKKAYDSIRTQFSQLNPMHLIDTKLAESSFDFNKLKVLQEENEAFENQTTDQTKADLIEELRQFKVEANIISNSSSATATR